MSNNDSKVKKLTKEEYKELTHEQRLFYDLKIGRLSFSDLDPDILVYVILKLSKHSLFDSFKLSFPDLKILESEDYVIYIVPASDNKGFKTSNRVETQSNVQIQVTTKDTDSIKVSKQLSRAKSIVLSILFNHKECRFRGIEYVGSSFDFASRFSAKVESITVSLKNSIVIFDENDLIKDYIKKRDYNVI